MLPNKKCQTVLALAVLALAPAANADEIVFFQDFGCSGASGTKAGGGVCNGGATTPQVWNQVTNPSDGLGGWTYQSTSKGVTETIRADSSVADVSPKPANFSVTSRNWDIHDGSQATQISGYRTPNSSMNTNMQGNMLGHVKSADYLPSSQEDLYYQIDGLALNSKFGSITLTFDYDSYIFDDGDGFGVAYSTNGGTSWDRLDTFLADSDMRYRYLPTSSGDYSLDTLLGEPSGSPLIGFDGTGSSGARAGTAMFDLSGFAGQTISLRFAYASNGNNSGSADGINIDNIKVSGICETGSGPNCDTPPGTGVPEPASLGLALLGLTAVFRRKLRLAA